MILTKIKTCSFSGHRNLHQNEINGISEILREVIIKLIKKGYLYFVTGGALEFDTLTAKIILDLKLIYPKIKLVLALPCLTQANKWNEVDKKIYELIKKQADHVIYTSWNYTGECMYKRNRYLIDCSNVCVCYLTRGYGGTAYTVNYANKKGLKIINIAKYIS